MQELNLLDNFNNEIREVIKLHLPKDTSITSIHSAFDLICSEMNTNGITFFVKCYKSEIYNFINKEFNQKFLTKGYFTFYTGADSKELAGLDYYTTEWNEFMTKNQGVSIVKAFSDIEAFERLNIDVLNIELKEFISILHKWKKDLGCNIKGLIPEERVLILSFKQTPALDDTDFWNEFLLINPDAPVEGNNWQEKIIENIIEHGVISCHIF